MQYANTHYHAEKTITTRSGFVGFPARPTTPAIKTRKAALAAAIEAGDGHGVSTCRYSMSHCREMTEYAAYLRSPEFRKAPVKGLAISPDELHAGGHVQWSRHIANPTANRKREPKP